MVSSNNMYLILRNNVGGKRTGGIRIKAEGDVCMGVVFLIGGGYKYQECLNNHIMMDEIVPLRSRKVS